VAGRFAEIRTYGGTPMFESIEAVEGLLRSSEAGNRLLVIFTDGMPACPDSVEEKLGALAREDDIHACAVILGDGHNQLEDMVPCERIRSLEELPDVLTRAVAELMRRKVAARRAA
jgi:hypothetical protein